MLLYLDVRYTADEQDKKELYQKYQTSDLKSVYRIHHKLDIQNTLLFSQLFLTLSVNDCYLITDF